MSTEKGKVRLCHILKWESFDGYGFNLHAIKGKPGQYVGKVDEGSPAEAAGLKEGDQILEVNGVCVKNETHKEVVSRIKTLPSEAKLLVIDSASDAYFKANGIVVDGSYSDIEILRTPPDPGLSQTSPSIADGEEGEKEVSEDTIISNDTSTTDSVSTNSNSNETTKAIDNSETEQNGHVINSLKLNMTAKELRAQLAARKKYDPKKDNSIDVRTKKDIVDKL